MQICLHSSQFFPVIGGIPQVSDTLANYWLKRGHSVIVVTDTPATDEQDEVFNFPVIRCPDSTTLKYLLSNSDVIISKGYSLKHLIPWLLSRKPIIWIHPMYIPELIRLNPKNWRSWFRTVFSRAMLPLAASHVYVSQAIKQQIGSPNGVVIYNPIAACFRVLTDVTIENDFAFFGRMDPEKGVDVLLRALAICKLKGKVYSLDLYGKGPALIEWQELANNLGIASQTRWYPFLRGEALVKAMNAAGAVVMPSLWIEPMGLVAVEAMACGKAVIGSRQGGLGEVLEGYGMTFENGNVEQLAECMMQLKENPDLQHSLEKKGCARSQDFATDVIGSQYLQLIERVSKK
ncbi:MAG: glycosyltransferase family 4 protein [Cyanomargarita calcarea GSE-NOS-MK-12-04C]|jgi:glycosyltransferase involved in cell wall biosynthesis|uniref:Glycosyltransferase family 4 protein n=1 Tax=Cyanomargarita calcarea GSE-NOS-MK-12-04C TaxID=2839659 RepID=A0A951QKE3_9CYAN|nr:glycosyltransferase family 4 protein [Cyanomargarita calcarea GSE-NOS-MK-12-04C]